uniref:Uncharacterized protein n=1 Tax=Aegilops tauschii subsp. strangulata TaxID=200361 RepID=A0A453LSN2_AEGTS
MDETGRAATPMARRSASPSATPTTVTPGSTASSCSSNSDPAAAARTPPPAYLVPWARPAGGGSGYYPGCRKDANCACEICLASINATRDLLPPEAASARRCFAAAARDRRPGTRSLFLARDGAATPGSAVTEPWTPPPRSTAKSRRDAAAAKARRSSSPDWALYALTVLGFLLLLWVDTGLVPEVAARGFGPKLSPEAVARMGREARLAPAGLGRKLRSLERGVGQLVGADRISNCSSKDSVWRLQQVRPSCVSVTLLNLGCRDGFSLTNSFPCRMISICSIGAARYTSRRQRRSASGGALSGAPACSRLRSRHGTSPSSPARSRR